MVNPWVVDRVPSLRLKHVPLEGAKQWFSWKVSLEALHLQGQLSGHGCHNFVYNSRILGFYWIFQ